MKAHLQDSVCDCACAGETYQVPASPVTSWGRVRVMHIVNTHKLAVDRRVRTDRGCLQMVKGDYNFDQDSLVASWLHIVEVLGQLLLPE